MNGFDSDYDDRSFGRPVTAEDSTPVDGFPTLKSVVVRYENQPDRCTITPSSCIDDEYLTTWLSADLDVFVDLDSVR